MSGEISALSTGFSEAVDLANAGEVKIIGVTSDERVDAAPDAMTMKEQGIDTTFVNWRGFFAAPGDFLKFLEDQEQVIGDLMKKLGFL